MLSLITLIFCVAYTAQAAIYNGASVGHSPFLHGRQQITGYSRHGDHIDAHVNTHVVDPFGRVNVQHDHVPVGGAGVPVVGGYNNLYNNIGGYNHIGGFNHIGGGYPYGYNNYNNYNNIGLFGRRRNLFRRRRLDHDHHIRTKRAALLPMSRYSLEPVNTSSQSAVSVGASIVDSRFGGRNSPNGEVRRSQIWTTGKTNIANRIWGKGPNKFPETFIPGGYKQMRSPNGLQPSIGLNSNPRSFNNMNAAPTGNSRQRTIIRRQTTNKSSSGSIWPFRSRLKQLLRTRNTCTTRNCFQQSRILTINPFRKFRPYSFYSSFGR